MGAREDCERRIQAQIREPLAVSRTRRVLAYLDSVARLPLHERSVVCVTMSENDKEYVELRSAYLESRKLTNALISTIKEKNNER